MHKAPTLYLGPSLMMIFDDDDNGGGLNLKS